MSGIQHFAFCRRQWALAYMEMQWHENVRTAEGRLDHTRCHDESAVEKRGDILILRGMRVSSKRLCLSGTCDVVEFHKDEHQTQFSMPILVNGQKRNNATPWISSYGTSPLLPSSRWYRESLELERLSPSTNTLPSVTVTEKGLSLGFTPDLR